MKLTSLFEQQLTAAKDRKRQARQFQKTTRERERRYAQLRKEKDQAAKERATKQRQDRRDRQRADRKAKADHEHRMAKFENHCPTEQRDSQGHLRTN